MKISEDTRAGARSQFEAGFSEGKDRAEAQADVIYLRKVGALGRAAGAATVRRMIAQQAKADLVELGLLKPQRTR